MKDLHQFIDSGFLELYAFNLLNEKEYDCVEAFISVHKEAKKELEAITESIEEYALVYSIKPAFSVKNNIISKLHS
jgi:hypothetical protein